MDASYIAIFLSPLLASLISLNLKTWIFDRSNAPAGLVKMGLVGQLYTMLAAFAMVASQFSLIGLVVFSDVTIGNAVITFAVGVFSGGVWIVLSNQTLLVNLLTVNLLMPAIYALSLVLSHSAAWKSIA